MKKEFRSSGVAGVQEWQNLRGLFLLAPEFPPPELL
jgi:hypothetical protein